MREEHSRSTLFFKKVSDVFSDQYDAIPVNDRIPSESLEISDEIRDRIDDAKEKKFQKIRRGVRTYFEMIAIDIRG